ncbi:hypothetical protein G9A89_018550 [Geosiphon pyriformis]|nr:hypothetical protein G9A89_018550 [Geosiphon pyriformis]
MFSGAALNEECLITAIYTEAKVSNTPIKLILNSGSAGSIVTLQLVNQLGFKVDCTTQETLPTTIVTVVTKKNTVTQKDMKNGTKNCVLLMKNHCQKGVTGLTCQTEKERVTQLANIQSSSVTG